MCGKFALHCHRSSESSVQLSSSNNTLMKQIVEWASIATIESLSGNAGAGEANRSK